MSSSLQCELASDLDSHGQDGNCYQELDELGGDPSEDCWDYLRSKTGLWTL